jgi:hypothetical protein
VTAVSEMQAKLHRWAEADPGRRFDDVFNFVHDPATLIVAFNRVANTPAWSSDSGSQGFWTNCACPSRRFRSGRCRCGGSIPKPGGSQKLRKLGIPTNVGRVVQAALKLALEPHFRARLSAFLLQVPAEAAGGGRNRRNPRHPTRRDPVPVPGQHRAAGARRTRDGTLEDGDSNSGITGIAP